ncbi:N-acetylmannosamine-6-phosphate 2-epimerase [Alkalicoccus luteus]|uniref:N-acetylmannosamine-6-phosphate 2-epimerase n=1 Tax=Alkalicoccus luteus TaxID=1237094 RepID=UPI0040334D11
MNNKLIVSCQALEDEPLHSSFIMSKMALAAYQGGASGIRANSVQDIQAIKQEVDLPIIGIIKQEYDDSEVVITPTIKEVRALANTGVEWIAVDATDRIRPGGVTFAEFFQQAKEEFPAQKFMADVSTFDEAIAAEAQGVDVIGTTLVGYTSYSTDLKPLAVLKDILAETSLPVFAEGNMNTPDTARKAIMLGAEKVVVGSAITRPQFLTERFSKAIPTEPISLQREEKY